MIQEVSGSELHKSCLMFRDIHLRRPIGRTLSASDVEGESAQWHFAAVKDGDVIGTVVLKPVSGGAVKLRQMAVDPSARGHGLGRELVQFVEAVALSRGFGEIEMMARVSAVGFYRKLGYGTLGDDFTEVGIPHLKMAKTLSARPTSKPGASR